MSLPISRSRRPWLIHRPSWSQRRHGGKEHLMKRALSNLLRNLTGRAASLATTRRLARQANRKVRLCLESLEDRLVPTIVFEPLLGRETLVAGYQPYGMQHPTVNLIFAGTYRTNSAQGKQDEKALINSVKSILSGPHLSGLTQYGSDGTANYGTAWNDPTSLANPSNGDLQTYVQNSIQNFGTDPGSNDVLHAPIYVVIADPGAVNNIVGFNHIGPYGSGQENIHMIYASTETINDGLPAQGNGVSTDLFPETFSHELAETISDPNSTGGQLKLPVQAYGNKPPQQVGDGEQEHNYNYRLNGVLVEAYWSYKDNAAIVPDVNYNQPQQKFYLQPMWSGAPTNSTLTGYALDVFGNQDGAGGLGTMVNDQITIDQVAGGSRSP
jgi:hypothetical protein